MSDSQDQSTGSEEEEFKKPHLPHLPRSPREAYCDGILAAGPGASLVAALEVAKRNGVVHNRNHCIDLAHKAELVAFIGFGGDAALVTGEMSVCACERVFH